MDVKNRLPSRPRAPQGRVAKIRLAVTAASKVLRTTFATGAVKGAAKARAKRSGRSRRVPAIAAAGAGLAAVAAVIVRKRTKASTHEEQHHEAQSSFPATPSLHDAETAAPGTTPPI